MSQNSDRPPQPPPIPHRLVLVGDGNGSQSDDPMEEVSQGNPIHFVVDFPLNDPDSETPGSNQSEVVADTSAAAITVTDQDQPSSGSRAADIDYRPASPTNRSSDDDSPNDDSNDEDTNTVTSQKGQPKKRGAPRKKEQMSFIKAADARTQHAKRTGQQLVRKVKTYEVKTGSKVFIQTQYSGPKSSYTFTYGSYWELNKNPVTNPIITESDVKKAVAEAVKSTLNPIIREVTARQAPSSSPSSVFLSPQKHQSAEKSQHCGICSKKEVIKDFIVYESEWIGCTGDGKSCSKWVHADCLGFPGITQSDVEQMPEYFCADHLSYGRQKKRVAHKYASGTATEPDITKEPPKKRNRGRPPK